MMAVEAANTRQQEIIRLFLLCFSTPEGDSRYGRQFDDRKGDVEYGLVSRATVATGRYEAMCSQGSWAGGYWLA